MKIGIGTLESSPWHRNPYFLYQGGELEGQSIILFNVDICSLTAFWVQSLPEIWLGILSFMSVSVAPGAMELCSASILLDWPVDWKTRQLSLIPNVAV